MVIYGSLGSETCAILPAIISKNSAVTEVRLDFFFSFLTPPVGICVFFVKDAALVKASGISKCDLLSITGVLFKFYINAKC